MPTTSLQNDTESRRIPSVPVSVKPGTAVPPRAPQPAPKAVVPAVAGRSRLITGAVALGVIAILALLIGLTGGGSKPTEGALTTVVAGRAAIRSELHEIGTLEALTETPVLSPVNGEIVWHIDDGTFVEAGEPIVRFDSTQLEDDIVVSEQNLQDKEEYVRRAEAQIQSTRERYDSLIRKYEIALKIAQLNRDDVYEFPLAKDKADAELALQAAALDLEAAEITLNDDEDLFKRGYISDATRKQAALTVATKKVAYIKAKLIKENNDHGSTPDQKRVADLAVKDAEKTLQVYKFNRDADAKVLNAVLTLNKIQQENAERDLARKKKVFDQATVRAQVRGRASFIDVWKGPGKSNTPIQVGEQRPQGSDLCTICDISALRVRVLISEADIKNIKEGQSATVTLRAFPSTPFKAKVSKVALVAQDKNVALSGLASRRNGEAFVNVVETKLDFTGLSEADMRKMRIGYTADVMIDLSSSGDVLEIPWTAVQYDKSGAPFAEVQAPSGALEKRMLSLGCFDANRVQVLDGVREGEHVHVGN